MTSHLRNLARTAFFSGSLFDRPPLVVGILKEAKVQYAKIAVVLIVDESRLPTGPVPGKSCRRFLLQPRLLVPRHKSFRQIYIERRHWLSFANLLQSYEPVQDAIVFPFETGAISQ